MQSTESLKRSIRSAEDLAGVVRTMKTMAAVSIRQYETAAESLRDYAATVEAGLQMVMEQQPHGSTRPHSAESASTGGILFGSDQGMCGQFNEQIAHFASASLASAGKHSTPIIPLLCVGHRVADNCQSAGLTVHSTFTLPGSASGITQLVQEMLPAIDAWRETRSVSRILVFYNRRRTASSFQPHAQQLLPLTTTRGEDGTDRQEHSRCVPLWTMDTDVLISRLVKQFLFVSLFRACAESLAGENASRISAMQAAERNIRERLRDLRSRYATQRQTTITEELLDVVTGFEALQQDT